MCCCLSTTYYNSSIYLPSSSAKKDFKKKQQSGDIYHQKTLLGIFLEFSRSKEKLKECFKIDDLMLAFQIVVLNLKQPQQQDFNWLGPSFLSLDFLKITKAFSERFQMLTWLFINFLKVPPTLIPSNLFQLYSTLL